METNQSLTDKRCKAVSVRGYFYNLSLSPFVYKGYPFPSAKKLELFARKVDKHLLEGFNSAYYLKKYANYTYDMDVLEQTLIKTLYEEFKATF